MAPPEDRDLAHGARTKCDIRASGLRGVARDVEHRLDQLLAIADDLRNARVVIALDLDAELGLDQASHALEHFVHAERLDARGAMRREHPVHQPLQAIGFLDDDLRVFAQLGLIELALEQLRRAAQAAQRILDFVREIADQLAVGLLLEHQALLARVAQLLLDRAQLREQREALGFDACHGARERQGLAAHPAVRHVLRRIIPVRGERLAQRAFELGALDKKLQKRLPVEALRAGGEQVLGGGVGVAHDELAVERDYCGGQQLQSGELLPWGGHLAVQVAQFTLERFDVLFVRFDAVLVRLKALEHARVIALVAAARLLPRCKLLACLGERGLLVVELAFQDQALALARGLALRGRFLWEFRRTRGSRSRRRAALLLRRRDVHLPRDDLPLLLLGFARVRAAGPMSVATLALEDLGHLRLLRASRSHHKGADDEEYGGTKHELSLSFE